MMDKPKIRQLIGANRLDEAIKELLKATEHTHHHNDVLLQSTRLNEYKSQQIKGIAPPAELNQLRNQIADAMLSIINDFSEKDTPSVLDNANKFSWTKWTGINDLKSWIAVFAGLAGILTFYFKYCKGEVEAGKLINATVFVENKNHQLVLQQQGKIIMEVDGGEAKEEDIDSKGSASFKNVKVGDKVRLKVNFSEPYHPIDSNAFHTIPVGGRINLTVGLQNLGRVFGSVVYRDQPLEGVLVDVEGLRDTTDLTGRFEISIPENAQRKDPEVKFLKKGFKMTMKKAYPQTNEPLNIVMEK